MASQRSWWASKARQLGRHVVARVRPVEHAALAEWLTPAQLALFDAMPVADRRHGLDVVSALRAAHVTDRDVHLAGLFHDAGKGQSIRLWQRVAWSLGELLGPWVHRLAARLPGGDVAMARLRDHAERSAELAAAVGCPPGSVALIRGEAGPGAAASLAALRAADEAS
ncbi:MAG: hypothetical protein ABIG85_04980 [Chloroflexota bacterium]